MEPVNLYLLRPGEVVARPMRSTLSGKPTDFRIFSNSADDIKLLPNHDFRGFVYAPYADATIQPNGDFLGAVWSEDTILAPGGGASYVDTAPV